MKNIIKHIVYLSLFFLICFLFSGTAEARTYTFDNLNRVTNVQYDNGSTIDYTYDGAANIIKVDTYSSKSLLTVITNFQDSATGTVTSNPAGISCPGSCSARFDKTASVELTAVADSGFRFTGWSGGSCSGTAPCTVTMEQNRNETANFAAIIYHSITANAEENGNISPVGNVTVEEGADKIFNINPNLHYQVQDVVVDSVSVGPVTSYTFNNVSGNHSISASFTLQTLTIIASAGANGSITPTGNVTVAHGSSRTFTISPFQNYHITDVLVNDVSVGAVSSYTFNNVTVDQTISATFSINTHTITASTGANGYISPSGSVAVNHNSSQLFDIVANVNYHIEDVLVDNVSVGTVSSYTFNTVTDTHTISTLFAINTHTITSSTGANGTISPLGSVEVGQGTDQTYAIIPVAGYQIDDVLVDGASVGSENSYTFTDVTSSHTISVTFTEKNSPWLLFLPAILSGTRIK